MDLFPVLETSLSPRSFSGIEWAWGSDLRDGNIMQLAQAGQLDRFTHLLIRTPSSRPVARRVRVSADVSPDGRY